MQQQLKKICLNTFANQERTEFLKCINPIAQVGFITSAYFYMQELTYKENSLENLLEALLKI